MHHFSTGAAVCVEGEGEKKMKGYRMRPWLSIGAALLGSFLIYMVPGVVSAACEDPPAPQVNWANCNKKSASLVNADLRGANLQQTNFMGAALGNINLQGADLTEANLLSANLSPSVRPISISPLYSVDSNGLGANFSKALSHDFNRLGGK
jgi:Pentapeptide repeats (8 copies)